MIDMVRCLSEHAVKVSETSCSSNVVAAASIVNPAVQNAVVSVYKAKPESSRKTLLITVTWCRNQQGGGGLIIDFGNSNTIKLNTFSRLFRKNKGQKSFLLDSLSSSKIDLFWDLSAANYQHHTGPEPVDGYYILVSVGADVALALGDLASEAASKRRLLCQGPTNKTELVSRREHYSGSTLHCATKAQFCKSADTHDIVVSCSSVPCDKNNHPSKQQQPVLYVSIDKRVVIKMRRLQWNFRGNQTVFVDGLLIDVMWDVHDWFFNPVSGFAVFMFKIRNGGESRLWLEDNFVHKNHDDDDSLDFSLLLYASKNP